MMRHAKLVFRFFSLIPFLKTIPLHLLLRFSISQNLYPRDPWYLQAATCLFTTHHVNNLPRFSLL